ncbi:MAG TPA: hypothetical protein VFY09_00430, partial [Flavobacteriaceae bacterium]|nr:hypothetical protein [Flavobacteriaceae bacterium]
IYPRIKTIDENEPLINHHHIKVIDAPVIQISATSIRNWIQNKKNVRPLLPIKVWNYIDEMNFYKKELLQDKRI